MAMLKKNEEEMILEQDAETTQEIMDEDTAAQEEADAELAEEACDSEECDGCEAADDDVPEKPARKIELSKKQKAIGIGAAAGAAALTAAAVAVKMIKGKK